MPCSGILFVTSGARTDTDLSGPPARQGLRPGLLNYYNIKLNVTNIQTYIHTNIQTDTISLLINKDKLET